MVETWRTAAISWALMRVLLSFGTAIAAMIRMIAMTMRSSMKRKPALSAAAKFVRHMHPHSMTRGGTPACRRRPSEIRWLPPYFEDPRGYIGFVDSSIRYCLFVDGRRFRTTISCRGKTCRDSSRDFVISNRTSFPRSGSFSSGWPRARSRTRSSSPAPTRGWRRTCSRRRSRVSCL